MGYRTVVILYNDQTSEWQNDPNLGKKIANGMNDATGMRVPDWKSAANLDYGMVVQCAHADTQTLAVVDGYHFTPLVHALWHANRKSEETALALLKAAAEGFGYDLVKRKE